MEQLNKYLFHRNNRVRRFKPNSRIVVNYFQNRRWQHVTLFEQLSGFWPYQSKLQQYPLQFCYSFLSLIALSATINKFPEYVGIDINMTIECCLLMFFTFALFVKFFFASIQQSTRRKVYEKIAEHFETMSDPEEAAVLDEGAEGGFKYTFYYVCVICLCLVLFDGILVSRAFYQYLFSHRELDMQMPVPMNFGFDHRKYWYIIVIYYATWICGTICIAIAHDLSFMLQVRHAAALFEIVRIRLRKASELVDEFENENERENMSDDANDRSYSLISSAIDLHSKGFEIVKLIEKSYSMNWFIMLLISTGGFGAGLHLVSTKFHDPLETLRYIAMFVMVLWHFQVIFSQGQIVIDSSSAILDTCCELKWYGLPKNSCKLLSVMMIRTSIPCQLTGAKLFPLSMESFSEMLKAGLSYYTVFREKFI